MALTVQGILKEKDIKKTVKGLSFEEAMKLLEELVSAIDAGAMPLESTVRCYEHGVLLVEHLRELLAGAEQKLKILQTEEKQG